jgi:hypothetical protein
MRQKLVPVAKIIALLLFMILIWEVLHLVFMHSGSTP